MRSRDALSLITRHLPLITEVMIRVLVSANSEVELAGLASLIKSTPSLHLVGSTLGGAELAKQVEALRPDVVLEQLAIDSEETSEWAASGTGVDAAVRVLLAEESQLTEASRTLGAADSLVRAVLPRWATGEEIVAATEAAAKGLAVFHPAVIEHLPTLPRVDARNPSAAPVLALSPRETEVLKMLADGLGNKEIAWRLHISEHTVKFHVGSIFNKLNASSRVEAVAIAIRRGLVAL